ncbi:MAG: hypothetical protein GY895_22840 [Phycisphaera sp.]|nr:hypothetical protein [Phycisphaera sp.]
MRDVLGRRSAPDWFVGVGVGVVGRIRRVPGTAVRLLLPGRAFSQLRLAHLQRSFSDGAVVVWLLSLLAISGLVIGTATIVLEGRNVLAELEASNDPAWVGAGKGALKDGEEPFFAAIATSFARLEMVGEEIMAGLPSRRAGAGRVFLDSIVSWDFAYRRLWDPRMTVRRVGTILESPGSIVGATVILTPMMLFLLPVSLRRCRVAPSQVIRLACLSLVLLVLPVVIESALSVLTATPEGFRSIARGGAFAWDWWSLWLGPLLLLVLLVGWWTRACGLLRLPRPGLVAPILVLLGVLLAIVIIGAEDVLAPLFRS